MISKVSPPTFTVVAIADPPMGAAGYTQSASVLTVSTVSGPTRFGISMKIILQFLQGLP